MIQETAARIAKLEQIGDHTFDMLLFVGKASENARPGQFISIKCGASNLLRRPISIADVMSGGIRIVFDVRGKGTYWLSRCHFDEEISIVGPLGNGFRFDEAFDRRMLFVGGGIGVPPIHFAAKRCANLADVVVGFRSRDAVIMEDDLRKIANTVTICTDDGSYGKQAFATTEAEKLLKTNEYGGIYACGPKAMLREISRLARAYDVRCQISLEERMGCTVGACLGCAVPVKTPAGISYKHVCKDGPVFDSREVLLDV